jgi:uncharacterized protein
MSAARPFAIITGASTGIGFELARRCAQEGYDLLVAADEPKIKQAAASLREGGIDVEALQTILQRSTEWMSFTRPRGGVRSMS